MSTRRAKRQGTIEPPSSVINVLRERVTVKATIDNKVRVKYIIITTYETSSSYTIYIGSHNIYCIDAQILKGTNTGLLTNARWDSECSIDEEFTKGVDTILIIKLLLTYVKDRYPNVTTLQFSDMSTKICDDKSSVNLAGMKLFTDGKTWYESHFDTKMDIHTKKYIDTMMNNATAKKNDISFNSFSIYANINEVGIERNKIEELYNTSKTWQGFFLDIRNIIGPSKFCIWLSKNGWFDLFIRTVLQFNTGSLHYMLDVKTYDLTYDTVKIVGGWRSITLKKKRR